MSKVSRAQACELAQNSFDGLMDATRVLGEREAIARLRRLSAILAGPVWSDTTERYWNAAADQLGNHIARELKRG